MRLATAMLGMSAPIAVWAIHFTALYGFTTLACARGFPDAVATVIAIATLVGVAACVGLIAIGWRRRQVFEAWLMAALAGIALLAMIWEAASIWVVPPCV